MSLPWSHHIVCKAPLTADYVFKVQESDFNRYHVIARHKGLDLYFYPRDRESRAECEQMVVALQEDLKSL